MDGFATALDENPELERRRALAEYGILDTPHEERFNRIARLAARLFDAPMAQVNFVDDDRIWVKACHGGDMREERRDESLCQYAVLRPSALVVEDAQADPLLATNPHVSGEPHIRFYAGAQLRNREGIVLGALCVIDYRPRQPDPEDIAALQDLAQLVVAELELRRTTHRLADQLGEQRRLSEALEESAERMADFLAATADLLWETDETLRVTSGGGGKVAGVTARQLLGRTLSHMATVFPTPGASRKLLTEIRAHRPFRGLEFHKIDEDGREHWVEVSGKPVFVDGEFRGYRGVTRDITDRKVAEDHVRRLAEQDPLTGLANRRVFDAALAGAGKSATDAVLVLNIDHFKAVNDRYGHDAGDALVRAIAGRITECIRTGDVAARIGGDEFAVILRGARQEQVEAVAARILAAMASPFELEDDTIAASLSIGGALVKADDPDLALKQADVALYRSKNSGRGGYCLYSATH